MAQITTIGLDLAKRVFQVDGIAADGAVVCRRQLRRAKVLKFSRSCRAVWLEWKPADPLTIGAGNCRLLGTRSG